MSQTIGSEPTIEITTNKDITGYTLLKWLIYKPDDTNVEVDPVVEDLGTGKTSLAVDSTNFPNAGDYNIYVKTTVDGKTFITDEPYIHRVNALGRRE